MMQIPLPTPDNTPPVTSTYFLVVGMLSLLYTYGSVIISIITLNAFIIALFLVVLFKFIVCFKCQTDCI